MLAETGLRERTNLIQPPLIREYGYVPIKACAAYAIHQYEKSTSCFVSADLTYWLKVEDWKLGISCTSGPIYSQRASSIES